MKTNRRKQKSITYLLEITITFVLVFQNQVKAQIVPDKTLPINSNVNLQGQTWNLTGGTTSGANLYHSFSQFSIPTGYGAYFNNALQIQNIITRVTGNSASFLDGNLRANGFANVFLINSNGVVFGPNATLSIGGSFVGSTAKSLLFSDGSQFNTKGAEPTALTINVPTGLIFDDQSGSISVQGAGHQYSVTNPIISPITGAGFGTGLRIRPGNTIDLVGNGITLQGGKVKGDHINIGSVNNGVVRIKPDFSLDYGNVTNFSNIEVGDRSALDASGVGNNSIDIHGQDISFNGGSTAIIQNQGPTPSGDLNVFAAGALSLNGTGADLFPTRLVTESVAPGSAGNINITSPKININRGADVTSRTYGSASSGSINITATDYVRVNGYSEADPSLYSFILTGTAGSGSAGNINIKTKELSNTYGGEVGSGSLGTGKSGDVGIVAETVNVDNSTPAAFGSAIFTISGAKGNSGNLSIYAKQVNVANGGLISAGTSGDGNGGEVNIVALDSVNVSGVNPFFILGRSQIVSGAGIEAVPLIRTVFGLTEEPNGLPGDVRITTQNLNVFDLGFIGVSNSGRNPNGSSTLIIKARKISLNNGFIIATSIPGGGGNITIDSNDIRLLNGSFISSSSGPKVGGNININTNLLTIIQNSEIRANSLNNFGGKVKINTQGLFISKDSKITASSNLGPQFSGSIQVDAPNPNLTPGKKTPIYNPKITKLSAPCITQTLDTKSEYIVKGIGGLPTSPSDLQSEIKGWGNDISSKISTVKLKPKYIRATGWKHDKDGLMVMTTELDKENRILTTNCNVP